MNIKILQSYLKKCEIEKIKPTIMGLYIHKIIFINLGLI